MPLSDGEYGRFRLQDEYRRFILQIGERKENIMDTSFIPEELGSPLDGPGPGIANPFPNLVDQRLRRTERALEIARMLRGRSDHAETLAEVARILGVTP